MNKLRWGKFFWNDWRTDNALAKCSLAAQGLWMQLLCIAAQGEDYGRITIGGRIPPDDELASLIDPPIRAPRFRRLLAELEVRNVVKRDTDRCLFCARMVSDLTRFCVNSDNGKRGASKRYAKNGHSHGYKQKQKESYLYPQENRDNSPDQSEPAKRVVRLDGARASQPSPPEPEPRGSDDYLRNLLRAYQTS